MPVPKVALIVLNYNSGAHLKRALTSLFALEYPRKEIIVADNASTDASFDEAKQDFPQASFLPFSKNYGFAAGMNRAIEHAFSRGADFVWLFNPDATAEKDALTLLVAAAEKFPKGALLSPVIFDNLGNAWFAGGKIDFFRMRAVHERRIRSASPYPSGFLSGCALLIPRNVWEQVGLFDEAFFLYYEDTDYSLRARNMGYPLLVVPGAKARHEEQSEESPQKLYYLVFSGLIFFTKHAKGLIRPYTRLYVTIRRIKNALDVFFGREKARMVAQAYRDFFSKRHGTSGNFPHLR